MKQYMVIERFNPGCVEAVYERFREKGRMLPQGLHYLDSWVNKELGLCFQLMETANFALFGQWTGNWEDLTNFEIVPIDGPPQESRNA
jgi:hypothetical protein